MSDLVTSPSNPVVKRIKALAQKKYREEEKVFVVEGLRHILQAVGAGWIVDTLAYDERAGTEKEFSAVLDAVRQQKARTLFTTHDLLSRMTGRDNAQSVLAVMHQQNLGLDAIRIDALYVALDGIRDPGNLGTIMRTLHAVGGAGVILLGETCDPWSPEAVRATVGSFADIAIIRASHDAFAAWKKKTRCPVIGTHLRTDTDYRKVDYSLPLILVMGSEQSGMSDVVAGLCDTLVKIPMAGETESLNLAVSTGIMLYEISRTRL